MWHLSYVYLAFAETSSLVVLRLGRLCTFPKDALTQLRLVSAFLPGIQFQLLQRTCRANDQGSVHRLHTLERCTMTIVVSFFRFFSFWCQRLCKAPAVNDTAFEAFKDS